jgi:phage terminase large subunit-like protein
MNRSKYVFDKRIAEQACDFFPRFLCFVEGEWAGKPFELSPWQREHTAQIFGWRRRKDGRRRYRFVRGWMPRKNAKSTWAAGIGHLLTVGDGEPRAQVYSHALDKSQASIVFDIAAHMTALSPGLANLYEITKTSLFCPANMGTFRPLSGEAYGKHGLSPHGNIGDEAHAWVSGMLHTFLIQGMGSRRQPLDLTISTAGEIKTYGHELYEISKAVIDQPDLDPETYAFIYEAAAGDDWTDPDVWTKANPNLGISLKREFLDAECKRARQSPRLENDFKRYHLNLWVEQARRWFAMHRWGENTASPNRKDLWRELPARFRHSGYPGFCGLDLGNVSDITAAVWVFPPSDPDGRVTLVPRFWCPADIVRERDSPRTPYKHWVSIGALMTTPGNVTDYDFIEHQMIEDSIAFSCKGLAYDPWNATQVAIHLQDEGLPCVEFRQGFKSMAAPSKEIERLFTSGRLEHGNHPVLEWMFKNATYRKDPAGNIKPDKEMAAEKIDGVVASVMGIGLMNGKQEAAIDVRAMIA